MPAVSAAAPTALAAAVFAAELPVPFPPPTPAAADGGVAGGNGFTTAVAAAAAVSESGGKCGAVNGDVDTGSDKAAGERGAGGGRVCVCECCPDEDGVWCSSGAAASTLDAAASSHAPERGCRCMSAAAMSSRARPVCTIRGV